jgi:hypothetical protein
MRGVDNKAPPSVAAIDTPSPEVRPSAVFNFSFVANYTQAAKDLVKSSYNADTSEISAKINSQILTCADTGYRVSDAYPSLGNERNSKVLKR